MNLNILLIEDNEQNRYLATFLLERRGHHVVTATTGAEGVATAPAMRPDIILLDIQLPGMDGYDVARSLRQIDFLGQTPIVAVTSYAMPGDREKCFAAGCDGYVEKPISPETFVDEVEAFHRAGIAGVAGAARGAG
ncbi:MAG: response regulator [Pseudomonadota bacterium]